MGLKSRQKGKVGEREVAALLREFGYEAQRGVQYAGGKDSPDVKHDLPGVHIEVKRQERVNLLAAYEQATRDAPGGHAPVVFHRGNREDWKVTMDARYYLGLVRGF